MAPRLLAVIPHYADPGAAGPHASLRDTAARRGAALSRCIAALFNVLGTASISDWSRTPHATAAANAVTSCTVDVVVLTVAGRTGFDHLEIDRRLFTAVDCAVPPLLLGFEARQVIRERRGQYDWYAYLEDDLEILDPWFLRKLELFTAKAGIAAVLQPQRFEDHPFDPRGRHYVDGALPQAMLDTLPPRDPAHGTILLDYLGETVPCRPAANPHSGCHFVTAAQLERWMALDCFADRSIAFAGPLESAATLALARGFTVYKPAPSHAGFLEIRHAGTAQLDRARPPLQPADDAAPAHRAGLLGAELERLVHRVAFLEGELRNREDRLAAVLSSRSWRAMQPLRRVYARLREIGRRTAKTTPSDTPGAGGGSSAGSA